MVSIDIKNSRTPRPCTPCSGLEEVYLAKVLQPNLKVVVWNVGCIARRRPTIDSGLSDAWHMSSCICLHPLSVPIFYAVYPAYVLHSYIYMVTDEFSSHFRGNIPWCAALVALMRSYHQLFRNPLSTTCGDISNKSRHMLASCFLHYSVCPRQLLGRLLHFGTYRSET